jgi:hypothetical protein
MTRTYCFTLTVTVGDDHDAYDDPEWLADAAWGVLTNVYGLDCIYGDIEAVHESSEEGSGALRGEAPDGERDPMEPR